MTNNTKGKPTAPHPHSSELYPGALRLYVMNYCGAHVRRLLINRTNTITTTGHSNNAGGETAHVRMEKGREPASELPATVLMSTEAEPPNKPTETTPLLSKSTAQSTTARGSTRITQAHEIVAKASELLSKEQHLISTKVNIQVETNLGDLSCPRIMRSCHWWYWSRILNMKWMRESAVFTAGSLYQCRKSKKLRNNKHVRREDYVGSVNTALFNYGLDLRININRVKYLLKSPMCIQTTKVVVGQNGSEDGKDMTAKLFLLNYIYFQCMKTKHHSLKMSRKPEMKMRNRLPHFDRELILHKICFSPAR